MVSHWNRGVGVDLESELPKPVAYPEVLGKVLTVHYADLEHVILRNVHLIAGDAVRRGGVLSLPVARIFDEGGDRRARQQQDGGPDPVGDYQFAILSQDLPGVVQLLALPVRAFERDRNADHVLAVAQKSLGVLPFEVNVTVEKQQVTEVLERVELGYDSVAGPGNQALLSLPSSARSARRRGKSSATHVRSPRELDRRKPAYRSIYSPHSSYPAIRDSLITGVKYISLAETTGYGLSAASYIKTLLEAGVPLTWHPKVVGRYGYQSATDVAQVKRALSSTTGPESLYKAFHAPIEYDVVVAHVTPEHWPAAIEYGKRMVGYTVWETDRLPLHWPLLLAGYDVILTPSSFSRDVFAPHTASPVLVLPHLPRVDWPDADPGSLAAFRRRFGVGEDDFLFYTVNSWVLRKAMWLTLQAFLLAFTEEEQAVMLLKTNAYGEVEGGRRGESRRLYDRILSNYSDSARVVYVSDEISHEDIGYLHLSGDAFVSLTRSEGFGLGAFDAATAGTPVIMTGWSGPLDFLPPDHACLVDYELRRVTELLGDHKPREQHWAHADLEHAIDWMRRLYENPGEAKERGAKLKAHIAEHFDKASIMQRFLEALRG